MDISSAGTTYVLIVDEGVKNVWFKRILNKELFPVSLRYNPSVKGALSGGLKFKCVEYWGRVLIYVRGRETVI